MGQVTLYLDRETEARVKAAAKAERKTLSRWVAEALRKQTAREWPASVLRLAGAWEDFPTAEEIRHGAGKDAKRERF